MEGHAEVSSPPQLQPARAQDHSATAAEPANTEGNQHPLPPLSQSALQQGTPPPQQHTSYGPPPLSPSSRTKSQEMQGRIRNFLAYASAQSSAASAAASAAAAAAAATDSAAGTSTPSEGSLVTGAAEPAYRSPFAAFEDGLRSTNSSNLIQFLGPEASGSLKSMGGSLRSEPSLPWADPGLLEEMRQASMRASYRTSDAELPLIQNDITAQAHDSSRPPSRQLSQVKEASPAMPSTMASSERIPSGPAPPASPFGDDSDAASIGGEEDFDFSPYGPIADKDVDKSGPVSIESQLSGLSSLSQSELAMVLQLTDELKTEPEAITSVLSNLNLTEELAQIPASEANSSAAARQAVLDRTMNRLRAVLPPEVAQSLPSSSGGRKELQSLHAAAAAAQQGPPPPFAEPVTSLDLDAAADTKAPG